MHVAVIKLVNVPIFVMLCWDRVGYGGEIGT